MPRRAAPSLDNLLRLLGDSRGAAHHYTDEEKSNIVDYHYNLVEQGLPVIFDGKHLSIWSGMDAGFLYAASNAPENFYRSFKIPKKSGGIRIIDEPLTDLKFTQRWILDNILVKIPLSVAANAYQSGVSIRDGARLHLRRNKIIKIDFKNFFGSIRKDSVYRIFNEFGYSNAVSGLLTGLTTFRGHLPQGAPTSAALSNIFMREFDDLLLSFARARGFRYSRYADDLILSGDVSRTEILDIVSRSLPKNIKINKEKTKIMRSGGRQIVTGIIVNKKLSAPIEMRKKIRQEIYYINKYGLGDHLEFIGEVRANYIDHIIGQIDFCIFCDPKNKKLIDAKKIILNIKRGI